MGGSIALAENAPATRLLAFAALATFEILGLWWVGRQLARVLPGRSPWAAGPAVAAATALLTLAASVALGSPLTGLVPALYGLRILTTPKVTSPRDARRVGLSEAGWAALAATLAVTGAS